MAHENPVLELRIFIWFKSLECDSLKCDLYSFCKCLMLFDWHFYLKIFVQSLIGWRRKSVIVKCFSSLIDSVAITFLILVLLTKHITRSIASVAIVLSSLSSYHQLRTDCLHHASRRKGSTNRKWNGNSNGRRKIQSLAIKAQPIDSSLLKGDSYLVESVSTLLLMNSVMSTYWKSTKYYFFFDFPSR